MTSWLNLIDHITRNGKYLGFSVVSESFPFCDYPVIIKPGMTNRATEAEMFSFNSMSYPCLFSEVFLGIPPTKSHLRSMLRSFNLISTEIIRLTYSFF